MGMLDGQIGYVIAACAFLISWAIYADVKGRRPLRLLAEQLREDEDDLTGGPIAESIARAGQRHPIDSPLGRAWHEYAARITQLSSGGVADRSGAARSVFSLAVADHPGTGLREYEATPNRLIGVGLAFTFIGLCWALYVAQDGLGTTYEETRPALVQLLKASSFKFATSICAIIAAVCLEIRRQRALLVVQSAADGVARRLEAATAGQSAEAEVMLRLIEEVRLQTATISSQNENVSTAVASELNRSLEEHLPAAFAPVVAELKKITGDIVGINQAVLQQMIDRFTEQLGGAARRHLSDLVELVGTVTRDASELPAQLGSAAKSVVSAIEGLADKTDDLDVATTKLARTADAFGNSSNQAVNALAELQQNLEASLRRVIDAAGTSERSASALVEASGTIAGAAETIAGSAAGASTAAARMIEGAAEGERVVERTATATTTAMRGLEELVGAARSISSDASAQFTAATAAIATLSTATSALAAGSDEFRQGVRELDDALARTIGELARRVAEEAATRRPSSMPADHSPMGTAGSRPTNGETAVPWVPAPAPSDRDPS